MFFDLEPKSARLFESWSSPSPDFLNPNFFMIVSTKSANRVPKKRIKLRKQLAGEMQKEGKGNQQIKRSLAVSGE